MPSRGLSEDSAQRADAILDRQLFDPPTEFEAGGHLGLRPRSPADAGGGESRATPERGEGIEKGIRSAIIGLARRAGERCHGRKADEEIQRDLGRVPMQRPSAANFRVHRGPVVVGALLADQRLAQNSGGVDDATQRRGPLAGIDHGRDVNRVRHVAFDHDDRAATAQFFDRRFRLRRSPATAREHQMPRAGRHEIVGDLEAQTAQPACHQVAGIGTDRGIA